MKIRYLQHEEFEDPGTILEWAAERGHGACGTMLYKGEDLPSAGSFDMLVVMGGSMSVSDEGRYPWLASEKKLIKDAIREGKAVLGICLGAQLMASALGARVFKNPCREIGWFPVTLSPKGADSGLFAGWPLMFQAFHWHNETFDLPVDAVCCASSKACRNQAFVYGRRAVALQFHVESTAHGIQRLLTECKNDMAGGGLYVQPADHIMEQAMYLPRIRELLFRLMDSLESADATRKTA
jgi:GMP synthase-like glutamine amidotransferase